MDESFVSYIESGPVDDVCSALKQFNTQNTATFEFPQFTNELRQKLYNALITRLNVSSPKPSSGSRLFIECLSTIRILSREKYALNAVSTEHALNTLLRQAGLCVITSTSSEGLDGEIANVNNILTIQDNAVVIEAQKCLCNIVFNCPAAQTVCSSNGCVEAIVQRLKTYKDPTLVHQIKYFDMRLLFVLTALVPDLRPKLRQTLHGFTYLFEVLDLTLRSAEETGRPLSDEEVDLCCEVLKILFNLTNGVDNVSLDEEEEAHFMRLVSVLHDLLICQTATKDKREILCSNAVNLLTQMPKECYEELLTPATSSSSHPPTHALASGGSGYCGGVTTRELLDASCTEYEGKNMDAIIALLNFLDKRLDSPQQSVKESLSPILHCLCLICRANRSIRTFCRLRVLPYMRDEVKALPEEGTTLRNRICKLFTNVQTEVKTLAADFMFVLCKENVGRFIKYTGYGNAAGLLAQRGLLCGGQTMTEYSSESEDSETEEYEQLKEGVNPITGRWEEEKPSPMEGMTEEQKEYEAMQLVNELDKLQRAGVIQPSTVSEEGRPVPVTHVLQLLEGMNVSNPAATDGGGNDSDSD